MSFLTRFILILCISTVFGGKPIKHESKPAKTVEKDTIIESNDRVINHKVDKTHEFKDNGSYKGTTANRTKSLSQKPKQADTEIKLEHEDYKISETNPNISIPETVARNARYGSNIITIMSKRTDPGTAIDQDTKIAENHAKSVKENIKNRSTNIITLSKKSKQKEAESKAFNKDPKRPGDLTNDNLEIGKSGGMRNARSTHNVTIISEHNNLLSVLMDMISRLMQSRGFSLSEQNWNVVSALFEAFLSVLFGPNIHIWWPLFTRILVTVMKVLT
ncbi:uncharacterized protein LOC123876236 [Maniola jurtina]|uniref:uncharacterized protein LOC123876236 n=1 Tax=Maniola jurtina TaxID=191418 RepID=UPI001E689FFC|nr:uncharacterized protein LOC123876236 [Maniola jurtina]